MIMKSYHYIVLFIIVFTAAVVIFFTRRHGSPDSLETSFALKDTAKVSFIIIGTPENKEIALSREEKGWLIESNIKGFAEWANYSTGNGSVVWTQDANVATRFCRKTDAEGLIDYMGYKNPDVVATEHIWD